jgi:4-amino-4-deoxy-L-arabinose transferase-like glycosyltransferase
MSRRNRRKDPKSRPAAAAAGPTTAERAAPDRWAAPVVIAIAALVMLRWSWGTWPDPIVDFGRELYVPWRLAEGETLYRDLAYFNGPLSPYVNATWFRLFGVSLRVLVCANIAITSALLVLLYVLLSRIGSRMSALLACLVFVFVFGFSRYSVVGNYNYVCPYSHEMTHGLVLSLAALFFLGRYVRDRRLRDVALCGVSVGLASLTKPEIFLAVLPAALVGIALALLSQREPRERAPTVGAAFLACALAPPLAAVALLSLAMHPAEAVQATLGGMQWLFSPEITSLPFYHVIMGTNRTMESAVMLLIMALWYVLLFAIPAGLGLFGPSRRQPVRTAVACFLAVAFAFLWHPEKVPMLDMLRPLPLVMLLTLGVSAVLYFCSTDCDVRSRLVLPIAMALFALFLLAKIILFARFNSYGFGLAMPATLLLVVLLWDWAPRAIELFGGTPLPLRGTTLAVLLAFVATCLAITGRRFAGQNVLVGSGGDSMWVDDRGREVNRALGEMRQLVPEGATLAVIPEGIMLNYLSRRVNPTPYVSLMPVEVLMFGEERILEAFQEHPPDYVVATDGPTSEYGFAGFGAYAEQLARFFKTDYVVLGRGPVQDGSQLHAVLLMRTSAATQVLDVGQTDR